jgi:hypothetical protein
MVKLLVDPHFVYDLLVGGLHWNKFLHRLELAELTATVVRPHFFATFYFLIVGQIKVD